jgi:hypothetical protein
VLLAVGYLVRDSLHLASAIAFACASFAFGILIAVVIDMIRNNGDRVSQHRLYSDLLERFAAARSYRTQSLLEATPWLIGDTASLDALDTIAMLDDDRAFLSKLDKLMAGAGRLVTASERPLGSISSAVPRM